jgi:hypothetical protein
MPNKTREFYIDIMVAMRAFSSSSVQFSFLFSMFLTQLFIGSRGIDAKSHGARTRYTPFACMHTHQQTYSHTYTHTHTHTHTYTEIYDTSRHTNFGHQAHIHVITQALTDIDKYTSTQISSLGHSPSIGKRTHTKTNLQIRAHRRTHLHTHPNFATHA